MANFYIEAGLDIEASTKALQDGLTSVFEKLDTKQNKFKIKVEFDDKMLSTLSEQLKELRNLSGKPTQSSLLNELKKDATNYYNILKKIKTSKVYDITQSSLGVWHSGSGKYSKMANYLNMLSTNLEKAKQSIKSFSDTDQLNFSRHLTKEMANYQAAIDKFNTSSDKMLEKGSAEQYKALNTLEKRIASAERNLSNWSAAEKHKDTSKAYEGYEQGIADYKTLNFEVEHNQKSLAEYKTELARIDKEMSQHAGTIAKYGKNVKSFGDHMVGLAKKFSEWFSVSQVIMRAITEIRRMISVTIELDTAMTELKKVTSETDATYEKFLVNAADRAKKLGTSLTDVVTATADFARLGYNINEASSIADAALVYKNVGDGIENISDSSESIISTMQAFGVEANNAMSIVDKFNEVGNNFPISSKGVGDAMMRSAAAMESANNTLDESIALITAANSIVQNPDTVGTTLKTVSMYLRAAKTEAEAAGESTEGMASSMSELREELLNLTGYQVDIQIDED